MLFEEMISSFLITIENTQCSMGGQTAKGVRVEADYSCSAYNKHCSLTSEDRSFVK